MLNPSWHVDKINKRTQCEAAEEEEEAFKDG